MRKDVSQRTKLIRNYNRAFIAAFVAFIFGVVLLFAGFLQYGNMVARSSTPLNTELNFMRSEAKVTVAGLYTDKTNSVLIVRLTASSEDLLKLPYKGSDYKVYISSKSYDGFIGQKVPILFGRYSTNGDLFLIIPKPTDDIYSVFVMNSNFINTDIIAGRIDTDTGNVIDVQNSDSITDEDYKRMLEDTLNKYEGYNDINTQSNTADILSNDLDVVGFRVTLKPAFDTEEYRVRVIDEEQLLKDNGEFDFEGFFNTVFKDNVTSTIEADYTRLENSKTLLTERVNELQERLSQNPTDVDVQNKLNAVQSELAGVQKDIESLTKSYNEFQSVVYKPSMFKDMQTEAGVMSTENVEAYNKFAAEQQANR